jgi:hypothetical protein
MFFFFTTTTPSPSSKPVRAALPPRKPLDVFSNEQWQSLFFSKLPAEARNMIYSYVFDTGPRELLSVEAPPLSLLLTCHKAYHEASILAFACHAFPISISFESDIPVSLSNATSHLSRQHIEAITSLSLDLGGVYAPSRVRHGPASILSHAALLFPNLQRFEIRILRGKRADDQDYHGYRPLCNDLRKDAVDKHAPSWFHSIIESVTKRYPFQWHVQWQAEWPQLKDDRYYDLLEITNYQGVPCLDLHMSTDAIGNVRGVTPCPCSCDCVRWTSVDIVQETGRRIAIDTVYYGPEDRPLPELDSETLAGIKLGPNAIILRPGDPRLPVKEQTNLSGCFVVTGHGHDVDEEYWESIRRRNGDWRAICKGILKGMVGVAPKQDFLGSKALNRGDWARLNENVQASDIDNEDKTQAVAEQVQIRM